MIFHRIVILCFSLLIFDIGNAQEVDLARGIVGYFSLDSAELSPLEGNPTQVNKGIKWVENRFGEHKTAVAFNGVNQQILLPSHRNLNFSSFTAYTVSFWLQPRDDNRGCIFLKDEDVGIKWNGMKKPLSVFNGIKNGFPDGRKNRWSSQEWYHIVLTCTRSKLSLFINGEEDQSWQVSPKKILEASDIYLGNHPYMWGGFTGKLDDLIVYNRALNEYEVLMLSQIEHVPLTSAVTNVNVGPSFNETDLIGTWQGILIQPQNDILPNYTYWLKFSKNEEGILKGYSRIEVSDTTSYGVSRIQGIISGNLLNFEEIQVIRQKNHLGYKWCKKYGNLSYDPEKLALQGKWYANNCEQGGELLLYKTESMFNFHDNRLSESIPLEEFSLLIKENKVESELKEKALRLNFEAVHFSTGSYQISQEAKTYLAKELVPVLKKYHQINVAIFGHTDNTGDDALNLTLSKNRARSIRDYLVQTGIDANRVEFLGFGESKPLADNFTVEGRRQNRRVEFELTLSDDA